MFYTVTNYSQRFKDINIIYGQSNLKAFVMLNCEDLEFSFKGRVRGGVTKYDVSQGNRSCCNSAIQCPICPRLHKFDKNPGLNTSKEQYSNIIIAPPSGNRKLPVYTNLNMQCPICTKLHIFAQSPRLKTSKCQYSVIIAPPVDNRICNALH